MVSQRPPSRLVMAVGTVSAFALCMIVYWYYSETQTAVLGSDSIMFGATTKAKQHSRSAKGLMASLRENGIGDKEQPYVFNGFDVPAIPDNYGYLEPMWACREQLNVMADTVRSRKLVFVHIFKTAGSTMRTLLRSYALGCRTGLAIVTGCSGLSANSMEHGRTWRNRDGSNGEKGKRCNLKRLAYRNGTEIQPQQTVVSTNTTVLENNVDILGGHLPLGSHYQWTDGNHTTVDPQYLVFLRDGVRKFVSAILYMYPDITMEEAIRSIQKRVRDGRKHGKYYTKYPTYLITPQQRAYFKEHNIHPTLEQQANLVMTNLLRSNAIIGIVERMSESLELLRYVVDRKDQTRPLFEWFGLEKKEGTELTGGSNESGQGGQGQQIIPSQQDDGDDDDGDGDGDDQDEKDLLDADEGDSEVSAENRKNRRRASTIMNQSVLSSSAVVAELEKDPEFMKELREFVKYDDRVLEFATKLHQRQYDSMLRSQGKVGK